MPASIKVGGTGGTTVATAKVNLVLDTRSNTSDTTKALAGNPIGDALNLKANRSFFPTILDFGGIGNGDPRFIASQRVFGGRWQAAAQVYGVYWPNLANSGLSKGNHFRNMGIPFGEGGSNVNLKVRNFAYGHGVAGFNANNTGLGFIPQAGTAFIVLDEDRNPASTTFGRLLS